MTTTAAPTNLEIPGAVRNQVAAVETFVSSVCTKITSPAQLNEASFALREIATKRRDIEAQQKSMLQPVKETERGIREFFRPPLESLSAIETSLRNEVGRYNTEQQRKREEEQRRLNEAAEKERQEREARAAEHRAKAESAETEAERARYERLADAQEEKASFVTAPIVPDAPKAEGVGMRDNWSCELVNLRALVDAVAAGTAPLEYVAADMKVLNGVARALKKGFNVPGCRAVNNPSPVVSSIAA